MSNIEQSKAMKLIKEVHDMGLAGTNTTVTCFDCNAIFPNSYDSCPNCDSSQS